jgi:hypothetical protein
LRAKDFDVILILASTRQSLAVNVYEQLQLSNADIPVCFLSLEALFQDGGLAIKDDGRGFEFAITTLTGDTVIQGSDVRVCWTPDGLYTLPAWFPYDNEFDLEYAQGEWYAFLRTLIGTQPQIRMINPLERHLDLFCRLEQTLLMQQFGLKTVDTVLTNDADEVSRRYALWNQAVIYQSVRQNFSETTVLTESDFERFNKLHLSPVLFQQLIPGEIRHVCLMGDEVLAVKLTSPENQFYYETCDFPAELTAKLTGIAKHLNTPWLDFVFIYQPETNDYYGTMLSYPAYDMMCQVYPDFSQVLARYLIKEYHR